MANIGNPETIYLMNPTSFAPSTRARRRGRLLKCQSAPAHSHVNSDKRETRSSEQKQGRTNEDSHGIDVTRSTGHLWQEDWLWLEEFAAPYYTFLDAGALVALASPKGGQPPLDPQSDTTEGQTEFTQRFKLDSVARVVLAKTVKLGDVKANDFDAVFYPGGHGPIWDLAADANSISLIKALYIAGKPVAAVCHAPAVLNRVSGAGADQT